MARLSLSDAIALIRANNKSTDFSNDLVLAMCWKESSFDEGATNSGSTATGLMQLTKPAVQDVNDFIKPPVKFEHSQMTDGAKNVQCGTFYLQLLFKRGKTVKRALELYGGHTDYPTNLLACETCLKGAKSDNDRDACLKVIHKFIGA